MLKKVHYIALLTSIVHSYDYALFSFNAAVLSQAFFSGESQVDKVIKFFLVFSITVIIRPFASMFFGKIGDKYGRTVVLKTAAFGVALPTFFIAFIPTYAHIGAFATMLFIISRLLVVAFLSGETDGIRIYINEKLSKKYQYLGSGLVTACSQTGSLIAAFLIWFVSLRFMPEYAWRVSFLLGGLFGAIIILFRGSFQETEEFKDYTNTSEFSHYSNMSIFKIVSENKLDFIRATLIQGSIGGIYHFHIVFFGIYVAEFLQIADKEFIKLVNFWIVLFYAAAAPIAGYMQDKFNSKKIAIVGISSAIILAIINMLLIANSIYSHIVQILIGFCVPLYTSVLFVKLKKSFNIGVRYRLFSFSHAIGSVILSAPTPIIASGIWEASKVSWLPILYLILLMSFLLWQIIKLKDI